MKQIEIKLTFTCDEAFYSGPMAKFKADIASGSFEKDILAVQHEKGLEDFQVTINEIEKEE